MIPEFVPPALLTNEAAICSLWAMVSIAYIYQLNPNFHNWENTPPNAMAIWVSALGPLLPNPTPGAKFAFSWQDLRLRAVKAIIATRGPPRGIFECEAGQRIVVF